MGNKEGKFKKIFEEIDTSGDCKVSLDELINFLGEKTCVSFYLSVTKFALRCFYLSHLTQAVSLTSRLKKSIRCLQRWHIHFKVDT